MGRRAPRLDILPAVVLRTSCCEPLVWFFASGMYFSFPWCTFSIGIHTILALALLLCVLYWNPGCSSGVLPSGPTLFLCMLELGISGWITFQKTILRFRRTSVFLDWLLYGDESFSLATCIHLTTTLMPPQVPCSSSLGELTGSDHYRWWFEHDLDLSNVFVLSTILFGLASFSNYVVSPFMVSS